MRALVLLALIAPVGAETLAVATGGDGSSIIFTDERGPCIGDARLAWYVSPDARSKVPGCYVLSPQGVAVSWLDGDRGDVPMQALKKPTSL
jgi:hypothetical protein